MQGSTSTSKSYRIVSKKLLNAVISALLTVVPVVVSASIVINSSTHAAYATPTGQISKSCITKENLLSKSRANELAQKISLSSLSKSGAVVDLASARAWTISKDTVFVNYSFKDAVEPVSNVGALTTLDSHIIATAEIVMTPIDVNSGRVQVWENGTMVMDRVLTVKEEPTRVGAQASDFWSDFNDCLSRNAVPQWVITGLGIACAALCVGTAGAACVACIAAAAGGFGVLTGACIEEAKG